MIRNLLILLVFLGAGFGANVAQSDIFVRQATKTDSDKDAGREKKKSIFLRPFKSATTPSSKTTIRSTVKVPLLPKGGNVPQQLVQDLKYLEYWQKAKRAPETIEEIRSYAQALRAPNMSLVVAKRNELIPALEASVAKQFSDLEKKLKERVSNFSEIARIDDLIVKGLGVASLLEDPKGAAKGLLTNYAGQSVKQIEAAAKKRAQDAEKAARSAQRIYRRPNQDNAEGESKAASSVYKNYR